MPNHSSNDVDIIRWPEESFRRERCRDTGRLRLLLIAAGSTPPICADPREDWMRVPAPPHDIQLRAVALRARAGTDRIPQLNRDGVVTFRGRSTVLSPREAALVEVLVRSFGELATREALAGELSQGDRASSRNSLDLHIMRIRRKLAPLGLVVRTAWGRGYLLEIANFPADSVERSLKGRGHLAVTGA